MPAPETIASLLICSGPASKTSGRPLGEVCYSREEVFRVYALIRKACDEADRLAVVQGEGLELVGAEGAGDQRVVADLGMGVEGKVVGGEAHVRVEEQLQAALHAGVDGRGGRAPEEPVVDYEQVGLGGDGALEELRACGDAGG